MTSKPDPDIGSSLPGSIRAVVPHPFGGRIVTAGFPGLEVGIDGSAVFNPDLCNETVQGLHDFGAGNLVVLVEPDELAPMGFDILARTSAAIGVTLTSCPIVDYSVPSDAMLTDWTRVEAERAVHLRAGGTLAFCCQHGAGRSGLMAALCLMEAGLTTEAAIATIRSHFAQSVESAEQEAWLQAWCSKRHR